MRRIVISILLVLVASCRPKAAPIDPRTKSIAVGSQSTNTEELIEDPFLRTSGEQSPGDAPKTDDVTKIKPLLPEDVSRGFGAVRAEMSPRPGVEVSLSGGRRAIQVTLAELSQSKSEQPIERRTEKSKRDKLDTITVTGGCQKSLCVDGVFDEEKRAYFIKPQPSKEEISAAKNGWVERLIRISSVGAEHTSIYLGRAISQDDKTTQAIVECATFNRTTGKRLSVDELIPKEDAEKKLRDAKQLLREKYPSYRLDPSSFLLVGSVPRGIRFCALSPAGSNLATILEVEL